MGGEAPTKATVAGARKTRRTAPGAHNKAARKHSTPQREQPGRKQKTREGELSNYRQTEEQRNQKRERSPEILNTTRRTKRGGEPDNTEKKIAKQTGTPTPAAR